MIFLFSSIFIVMSHQIHAEVPWEEVAPDEPETIPVEYKPCQNRPESYTKPLPEKLTKNFQDMLQKRILTLIENKIELTRAMRTCFSDSPEQKGHPSFCQGTMNSKLFFSFIKPQWREMRIQLALSMMEPASIIGDEALPFIPRIHHIIADFPSIPELNEDERKEALKQWKNRVAAKLPFAVSANTPYIKNKITRSDPFLEMRKEARQRYFEILESMPLLGYIQSSNPSKEEIAKGFNAILNHLTIFSKRVQYAEETTLLISFKPLVEEILQKYPQYCPSAAALTLKAQNMEKAKTGKLVGGALILIPFCASGPVGLSICLLGGLGVGMGRTRTGPR